MRARLLYSAAATRLRPRLLHRTRLLNRCLVTLAVAAASCATTASAQQGPGYYTDPATGYVYRRVTRTIERPVVETQMQTRQQTIYRPQTVTETRPETKTVYTPVVEYRWEPRLEGRWNPFRQPRIAYHYVPHTNWEARSQTVQRTTRRTQWVAEKREVTVPQRLTRIEREQKTEYELVGRVAPPAGPNRTESSASAIASRLRPLDDADRIAPIGHGATPGSGSTPVGNSSRLASGTAPRRSSVRSGALPATELTPGTGGSYHQPLPPAGGSVANLPAPPLWR